MEAIAPEGQSCPACDSTTGAEFLLLRVVGERRPRPGSDRARIEVVVSCGACHHRRSLLHSYPHTRGLGPHLLLGDLQEVLAQETGVLVFVEPPDDDPRSGVREPRRPLPGAGSAGIRLVPPA